MRVGVGMSELRNVIVHSAGESHPFDTDRVVVDTDGRLVLERDGSVIAIFRVWESYYNCGALSRG